MDANVARKTRESLGTLIKKPPLTEKLLSRPPFRFLHDILTEVIKHTGYLGGLYTPEELNSENVKDKGSKIAFLQKAVDVVAFTLGQQVSCRPSKVVAGHEPERTNEFLQLLAAAIIDNRDCGEAVRRVLNGEKPTNEALSAVKKGGGGGGEGATVKPEDAKSKSHSREREKSDKKSSKDTSRTKDRTKPSEETNDARREKSKERSRDTDKQNDRRKEDKSKRRRGELKMSEDEVMLAAGPDRNGDVDMNGLGDTENEEVPKRVPRPTSPKGPRRSIEVENVEGEGVEGGVIQDTRETLVPLPVVEHTATGERPTRAASGVRRPKKVPENKEESSSQSALPATVEEPDSPPVVVKRQPRPSSARPAPPRVKNLESREDPDVRIGSGREKAVVAPVIVEDGARDEEDEFIVEEIQQEDVIAAMAPKSIEDDVAPGALVKTLEETQKKLEAASEQHKEEQTIISDTHQRKERERVEKEIDRLSSSIQSLTSSAHPLGRTMNYIQEDIDSMQKELANWQTESSQHGATLKREREISETEVEPLKRELEELETQIHDQVELTRQVKARIIQNDERIQKMLTGVLFKS
ncbi:TRAF3-interacting protein 1-like isoform X2 [Corticium candelabrum]|uniref:TRAF3-interacting protein 1-like isoform X2 n=1 Tax=Corticium candelabrum TaxID=121492 RepID=UPI002E2745EF|nr:TRAF3-interacting protein 1-like isoform X2 [Corticium candelabrum]